MRRGTLGGVLRHADLDEAVEGGGVEGPFVPLGDESAVEGLGDVAVDEGDQAADDEAEGPDVGCGGGVDGWVAGDRGRRGLKNGSAVRALHVRVVDFAALVVFRGQETFGAQPDCAGCPVFADGFVGHCVGDAQVGDFEVRVQRVGLRVRVEDEDVGGFEVAVD